jgi:hypothetical protein
MVSDSLSDPRVIAAEGERIYKEKYLQEYEARYRGQYVVIDVKSGLAYRGPTPEAALLSARGAAPTGLFHLIKIGDIGAFRSSAADAHSYWAFS